MREPGLTISEQLERLLVEHGYDYDCALYAAIDEAPMSDEQWEALIRLRLEQRAGLS